MKYVVIKEEGRDILNRELPETWYWVRKKYSWLFPLYFLFEDDEVFSNKKDAIECAKLKSKRGWIKEKVIFETK